MSIWTGITQARTPTMNTITRSYDARIDDVSRDDMSLVAKINTSAIDRFQTVIDPKGGRFANYMRNRVVLWEHGKDPRIGTDPIGRCLWMRHNGGERPTEIRAKTQFLKTDHGRSRWELYRDGVLNAFSVNILPDHQSSGPPTKEELRSRPELVNCHTIYRTWDLAEYSGTSIPGNADALVERSTLLRAAIKDRGLWVPDEVRQILNRTMTDSIGGLASGGATVVPRYIRHEDGKWCVYSESGKKLGEHESEEDAKKQLAAIEANKGRTWVDTGSGLAILRGPDGSVIMTSHSVQLVRDALSALESAKPFAQLNFELTQLVNQHNNAQRLACDEIRDDLKALLDLTIHGRV